MQVPKRFGARTLKGLALATVALAPSMALADESAVQLTEIIVTARKTSENVQIVPITVNVLRAEDLESRGAVTVANIGSMVPNVLWDDSGGGTLANRISIRGIPSNASKNGFDPGVGIYMDDVYIGDEIGFNRALLDVDRIEVLKGPQGTLFGRNTTAGAISMHTRRPSTSDHYVDADLTLGNYNLVQARLVANMPINDQVALKVSAIRRKRDGYAFNTVTNDRDANDENHVGGRVQLLFKPNDDLDILASAEWFKDKGSNEIQSCFGVGAGANPCGGIHPNRASVVDQVVQDNNSRSERTMWSASLAANLKLSNGYELTSISAYRNLEAFNDQDQDYTSLDYIRSGFSVPKNWQVSQELRLATPSDGPIKGVGGLYYFKESRRSITPLTYKAPVVQAFGGPAVDGTSLTTGDQVTESWAVFGQGTWEFTPGLTAELGARYTADKKDFTYSESLSPSLLAIPLAARNARGIPLVVPLTSDSDSWGQTTGTASLSWRPLEHIMAYARFSRGYKSGGYNNTQSNPGFNPTKPFGPETLDQVEIGAKTELFDRLRLNFAIFQMDYADIQLQITNPITFEKYVDNAGDVRSKGAEVEFSTASFAGLSFFGNAGLQHSKYTEIKPGGTVSLVGKAISYAPKATASLGAEYVTDLPSGLQFRSSVNASYRSDMWLDNNNTTKSPAVTLVNARLGIEQADGRWGVFLWGANLGDSLRITATTGAKAGLMQGAARVSTPRTFGLEIRGSF